MRQNDDSKIVDALLDNIIHIEDERQENCIHCNKRWYSKHYRDGVCHSCQQKGLPGRTVIENRQRRQTKIAFAIGIGAILFLLYLRFSGQLPVSP